jgi:hypothetical protein
MHWWLPCRMTELQAIADRHGLVLIEMPPMPGAL